MTEQTKIGTSAAAIAAVIAATRADCQSDSALDQLSRNWCNLLEALSAKLTTETVRANAAEADKLAMAQLFDKLHPDPALMARIIMASIENGSRAETAEAALADRIRERDHANDCADAAIERVRAAEAERDAFRAVLVGAGYQNIDEIGAYSVPDATLLGVSAKRATQKIIAERDTLRTALHEAKLERDAAHELAMQLSIKAATEGKPL